MTAPSVAPVRWGVLGTAKIAREKVIPGMQRDPSSTIAAIASRDAGRARAAADRLGIATSYGSYDALLDDPGIEAVYIPLPNHLHVPWTIRAAEAGKHVLVEKPIALSAREAEPLLAVRDRTGVLIQEAFMIRSHPQWTTAVAMVREGRLGALRSIMGYFSYFNEVPSDVRNVPEFGGGGLLDIGCYLVHTARWIVGREPGRVIAAIERDSRFGVDRLTSLLLDFDGVHAVGTCGTQSVPYQRVHVMGTRGRIELEIPFNAPPDRSCRLWIDDGSRPGEGTAEVRAFDATDQYTKQGAAFSRAIRAGGGQALPLETSIMNMRVLDAVMRSSASQAWERP